MEAAACTGLLLGQHLIRRRFNRAHEGDEDRSPAHAPLRRLCRRLERRRRRLGRHRRRAGCPLSICTIVLPLLLLLLPPWPLAAHVHVVRSARRALRSCFDMPWAAPATGTPAPVPVCCWPAMLRLWLDW